MIVTFIFNAAYFVLSGIQNFLSGGAPLNASLQSALTFLLTTPNQVSYLLNVNALFLALSITIVFELVIWSFAGGVWVYRHIPFIGH